MRPGDFIKLRKGQDSVSTHVPIFGGYNLSSPMFNDVAARQFMGIGPQNNKNPNRVYGSLYLVLRFETSSRLGTYVQVMGEDGICVYADVVRYKWEVIPRGQND